MDYDLWLRFIAAGANFLAVDEYFGLFRWYPGQKSTDIWKKHGVPEIAKLQEKHLGHAMPEDEMIAVYQEYWYGSNRLNHLDAYKHSVPTWQTFTTYKKQLLRACTRDAWVYLEELSIPKRSAWAKKKTPESGGESTITTTPEQKILRRRLLKKPTTSLRWLENIKHSTKLTIARNCQCRWLTR